MMEMELWGGHECTVNRIGDRYQDQTRRSGHHWRLDDLDRFAALGLSALRYPVLWERTAPGRPDEFDWRWSDERLDRLNALKLRPIVGLLHHGSGPLHTHLLSEDFAELFAAYARAVAERYPWVAEWTPVNEPLTTARFSALYGHWYPHLSDERAFWGALINQVDATGRAMREIRTVNPDARLVQTEDLGRTYATPGAGHQASFDNDRRWMTWDLLEGRVTPGHPLWRRLVDFGFETRLRKLADAPTPPDVVGVNHYLTSDRFLDHRTERYPSHTHGGNQFTSFADVEAIRVATPAPAGLAGALQEAWARYRRPLAVTESHAGCTREEQLRWLREGWETAHMLRERGVDVRAFTAWALLGAYDWDNLLTSPNGRYEPGAFDVQSGFPRPTAIAGALRALSGLEAEPPPTTAGLGWWRRDIRLIYNPVFRSVQTPEPPLAWRGSHAPQRPVLIAGASGSLGRAFARACEWRGIDYLLTDRACLSLDCADSIERMLERHSPWVVVNAAGWVRVDEAEADEAGCFAANADGAVRLARTCARRGIRFVGFSSDLVFDGLDSTPYDEGAAPNPLNVYGRSKAAAEAEILALDGRMLMVRTAAFFSPYDPHNFAAHVLRSLVDGQEVTAASDLVVSPTYVPDLVDAALDLAIDGEAGLWHLANPGAVSWAEFARMIASSFGYDPDEVRARPWRELGWRAERPAFSPLTSRRGRLMPTLEDALARFRAVVRAHEIEGEEDLACTGGAKASEMARMAS